MDSLEPPLRAIPVSELTIPQALAVLGLDVNFLNDRLDLKLQPRAELSPWKLPLNLWSKMCLVLFVTPNNINFGYDYEEHRRSIWYALRAGRYDLPLNRATLKVLWHVVLDRHEQAEFYRKEFPLWRRWQARWIRFNVYREIIWRLVSKRRERWVRRERLRGAMMARHGNLT